MIGTGLGDFTWLKEAVEQMGGKIEWIQFWLKEQQFRSIFHQME